MTRSCRRTAVVLLLVAGGSVSCSDDPYADYCEVVTDRQEELTRVLDEGGPDALLRALPIFRDLQEAAPDDIRDDWQIVVNGLTALQTALDDAGVDPATYDREKPPDGVSDEERDRIDAAAQELTTSDSEAAFAAVEQQARDVCQAPLRL
jgi:hypothetical protein